ncbi:Gp97 [Mycolicibacterium canariasense]|uniref:Gp97 n=1 Tax=Mycolicibacterium canariasense TaxID=228230 RepID=A0A100WCK8_MYCCR|nr:Gp97 [Mycolicibacterium canariasense]
MMPTYRVTCTGRVTEIYIVEADSAADARNNWCDGQLIHSEAWDVLPEGVELEDD